MVFPLPKVNRGASLVAFALLCSVVGCNGEVTITLLTDSAAVTAGQAGLAGAADNFAGAADNLAGDGGRAGAAGETSTAGGEPGDLPAPCQKLGPEVCNGGDDDCNGEVDEGCAYTVAWKQDPAGAALGHITGGTTFIQPCPNGAVLTGMRLGMGTRVEQVAPICQQIELQLDDLETPTSYWFTVGPRLDLSIVPDSANEANIKIRDIRCPDGQLVSAADGTTGLSPSYHVQRIRLTCAAPLVTTELVLDVDHENEQPVAAVVCTGCTVSPTYNFGVTIPAGHLAARLFGGVGAWIDRVGFGSSVARIVKR